MILSMINCARVFHSSAQHNNRLWIIDSRATYRMTFDSNDFCESTPPERIALLMLKGSHIRLQELEQCLYPHLFPYLTLDLSHHCQIN